MVDYIFSLVMGIMVGVFYFWSVRTRESRIADLTNRIKDMNNAWATIADGVNDDWHKDYEALNQKHIELQKSYELLHLNFKFMKYTYDDLHKRLKKVSIQKGVFPYDDDKRRNNRIARRTKKAARR